MKGLRVTKNVEEIKFDVGLGQVRIKKRFPKAITHKIIETNSSFRVHYVKNLVFVFQEFSANINKTFFLTWRLGTRVSFYGVLTFF